MTEKARIARLTSPEQGKYVIMYQLEGQHDCTRVEINFRQLGGLIADGASMAFRATPNDIMKEFLDEREKA